ncbi:hypothetical protein K458DRAFT_394634 [Lentithecium fluviatile CBS 122367]|uniref:Uncharacterized protein n=1 Tax=Lentithecium fluviatile CBS 122367 TaxID=1168545 RepID=A0A6G1ILL1_9PLEO|nr:hypothetical protein K458DRAFT_394634 [Lentithecium fluviatile CBS 122367]
MTPNCAQDVKRTGGQAQSGSLPRERVEAIHGICNRGIVDCPTHDAGKMCRGASGWGKDAPQNWGRCGFGVGKGQRMVFRGSAPIEARRSWRRWRKRYPKQFERSTDIQHMFVVMPGTGAGRFGWGLSNRWAHGPHLNSQAHLPHIAIPKDRGFATALNHRPYSASDGVVHSWYRVRLPEAA